MAPNIKSNSSVLLNHRLDLKPRLDLDTQLPQTKSAKKITETIQSIETEQKPLNHLSPLLSTLKTTFQDLPRSLETLKLKKWYRLRALLYIILLLLGAPFCLLFVLIATLIGFFKKPDEFLIPIEERRTVLVSGAPHTKGLHIAKALAKVGHTVIMADMENFWFSAARWSKYISKFYSVPNIVDAHNYDEYVAAMKDIALTENVDWYIPISHTKTAIADTVIKQHLANESIKCLVFDDPKLTDILDDKLLFLDTCKRLNLLVPDFYQVNSLSDVQKLAQTGIFAKHHFFLKPLAPYSDEREDFTRIPHNQAQFQKYCSKYEGKIRPDSPYFINQFVKGREYCGNAIVSSGELQLFQCCPSSPMQIDYDNCENEAVYQWVKKFCKEKNITGSICFDFLEDESTKEVYCIECNPRLHSAIVMFDTNKDLASAVKNAIEGDSTTKNRRTSMATPSDETHVYWAYNEIGKLFLGQQNLIETFRILFNGRDAVWDCRDPLPFLMLNNFQMPMMLLGAVTKGSKWNITNYCLGQLR